MLLIDLAINNVNMPDNKLKADKVIHRERIRLLEKLLYNYQTFICLFI